MKRTFKRIAAIHDLSGFGRSSLHVVIPILSTMGIQVCSVPTAILSTHTGGFEGYSFVDLTPSLRGYLNHWKQLNLDFDCIYSGFLGSADQIEIISQFIDDFNGEDTLVVVDPVMADNGQLYATMDQSMVGRMRHLITKADIITPNYTEMLYLLGKEGKEAVDMDELKQWIKELADMGPDTVVVTSVPEEDLEKKTSVIAYSKEDGRFWKVSCVYIPTFYPGTGDIFTSVIVGSILQGDSLPIALDRGVQFVTSAIRASYGTTYPERDGVLLEKVLHTLSMPFIPTSYEMI